MFYKNATIFQLTETVDFYALEAALPEFALKECGSQDEFSFGTLPLIRNSETWFLHSKDCLLIRFSKEEKVLPSSVVNEMLDVKVAEIELVEGRKIGRKERTEMKDELVFTFRPKAFAKHTDIWMHIDNAAKIVVIYSTTAAMIELAFKHLQTMLGSFPMVPLQAQALPANVMTGWLETNAVPASLETGDECDIQENSVDKARITFKSLEPLSADVTRHLEQGMSVKCIADQDQLYPEAVKVVVEARRPLISFIQRRLKISYNRAANIMEEMEKRGVVSAADHNGQREVLQEPAA